MGFAVSGALQTLYVPRGPYHSFGKAYIADKTVVVLSEELEVIQLLTGFTHRIEDIAWSCDGRVC